MIIRIFLATLVFSSVVVCAQQVKSPDEFLGYELGNRFTPHQRMVDYFNYVAQASPTSVKLEQYGLTYENRPLLLAMVSAPSSIGRLEEIRKNNLALVGMESQSKASVKEPVVVWLSYNVHGNESSSSEVAMKVLYQLATGQNQEIKRWLENTVVLIDPCLNPDGRERYVSWYNRTVGSSVNPDPQAAEHNEPWPQGRGNHYYFDLNRDWAWQTQAETRARIKMYNKWMPALHADYHEQYPGSPYYFAPAAEPFHEVITPWQRNFQTTIGKNHARYFDANGWLYFTREYFDLFYPAYGDTYPIYNGSIGMTYEQAGHGVAGLAIKVGDDTLTLKQRIEHHYTTSISILEVAANNAEKINAELQKYFLDGSQKGLGEYSTYLLNATPQKMAALTQLLDVNGIKWQPASNAKLKGFNYFTGKEESFSPDANWIMVPSAQAKAALTKVLFEPHSRLSDSSTYDITAWALPYAFGIQAYAVKEKAASATRIEASLRPVKKEMYGYLAEYNSFSGSKLLADLLNKGVRVRYSEKDILYKGRNFSKGSLIILKSGNEAKMNAVYQLLDAYNKNDGENYAVAEVESGFMDAGVDFGSDKLHLIEKPNVAVMAGDNVTSTALGEIWYYFERELGYPLTLISANDPDNIDLKNIDVLILPSGEYKSLSEKEGCTNLKSWIRQGGRVIALESAVAEMAAGDWGFKKKKEPEATNEDSYANLRKYGNRDRDGIVNNIPGAIYKLELDNTHPLAFGYPAYYFSLKQNSDMYEFLNSGWNVGVIKKEKQLAGFVGSKIKNKIQDGTSIGVQPIGAGSVIFFADDPVFRCFWENGKQILANAIFLCGQ